MQIRYIYIFIYTYIYIYIYIYVCVYMHNYIYIYNKYAYIYICSYMYTWIFIYMKIWIHVFMYTYTHISRIGVHWRWGIWGLLRPRNRTDHTTLSVIEPNACNEARQDEPFARACASSDRPLQTPLHRNSVPVHLQRSRCPSLALFSIWNCPA